LKNLRVLGTENCPPKRLFQEPYRRWGSSRNLLSCWGFLQEPNCPTEIFGFEVERTTGAGT
jgi:hypothetical protein